MILVFYLFYIFANIYFQYFSNLDYESCEWTFKGVFDMTSLVTICDGQIAADGQVREVTLVMF